ncbi:MAG TPA: LssY C-terminal domain-containing protein, partial [Bryobacteraceae bacterium]
KLNNTFAMRHHLRVWQRPSTFLGKPVWSIAATHDMGISFSEANRTFIHKIDSQIDRERAKVVNDLLFTGRVQSLELVDRPAVPQNGQNATGDNLETDAKIAVLLLQ